MPDSQKKKVALITGGSSGIGEAIVRRLSNDGYKVFFTFSSGRKSAIRIATETNAVAKCCDLSQPEEIKKLVVEIDSADILINNAGIIEKTEGIGNPDFLKAWRKVMRINLDAAAELTHFFVPSMAKNGWGRVINISSVWGQIVPENRTAYGASKAGLNALTRSISTEFAKSGVTANSIAPGPIETPIWEGAENLCKQFGEQTPLGRPGKPIEIAALAAFLASDEAGLITGQSIAADGGMTAHYPLPF